MRYNEIKKMDGCFRGGQNRKKRIKRAKEIEKTFSDCKFYVISLWTNCIISMMDWKKTVLYSG